MVALPKMLNGDEILQNKDLGELAKHLGFVVIVWGMVEEATRELFGSVALINEGDRHVTQTVLAHTPFRDQVNILRRTAFIRRPDSDWYRDLDALLTRIERPLHDKRNRFIHDPWIENDDGIIVRTERGKGEVTVAKDKGTRTLKVTEPKPATLDEVRAFLNEAYDAHKALIQFRIDYILWFAQNPPPYLWEELTPEWQAEIEPYDPENDHDLKD